jgi:ectoine hydroxylase-related dioxygenase (phytanoyl-CoA dioxygenase family)
MKKKNLPLTESELQSWHKNGFIVLKNVLDKGEITKLTNVVDRIVEAHDTKEEQLKNTRRAHGNEYYNIHNPFDYTDSLDYLIDHPRTFDVVTYLMGPYIQAMSCHIFVRHPCENPTTNIARFHTDSGPALQRILPYPDNIALQLKVQYFLADIQTDNASNFIAVPGSHMRRVTYHHPYCLIPEYNKYLEQGNMPPDAIQLKLNAGDVLIHALTLWHAVAPNQTSETRRSISTRYGQMWFKDYYFQLSKKTLERMTPRQRRLLGDFGEHTRGDIAYRPPDDHVLLILGDKAADYGWSLD